jgi:hypothetical protein
MEKWGKRFSKHKKCLHLDMKTFLAITACHWRAIEQKSHETLHLMRQELELQLWRRRREGGGGGQGGSWVQQAAQQAAFRAFSVMKKQYFSQKRILNPTSLES